MVSEQMTYPACGLVTPSAFCSFYRKVEKKRQVFADKQSRCPWNDILWHLESA